LNGLGGFRAMATANNSDDAIATTGHGGGIRLKDRRPPSDGFYFSGAWRDPARTRKGSSAAARSWYHTEAPEARTHRAAGRPRKRHPCAGRSCASPENRGEVVSVGVVRAVALGA
jgi:hypothetical protein